MKRFRLMCVFALVISAVIARGAWYDDPVVRSTQSSGYSNTSVHYINLSEDGKYLMVNLHSSNDAYPVQVYDVAALTAAKGTVLDLTCPEAFPTKFTWGSGVNGWKGGAISSTLGLMIPGCNGGNAGSSKTEAVFTSLTIPNTAWIANTSAFQLSGLGTGGIDGLDFNASGTRLYGNQYSENRGNLVVFDTATLKNDHTLTLLNTVTTAATRIRNVSCYTIGGKDLVYFGEGDDKGNGKVYVYDPSEAVSASNPVDLNTSDVNGKTVMNVKLSGTATSAPTMYVLTDEGVLYIYTLSANGKALASGTPKIMDNATVNRLCGVSGQTSKFRNFEVTDDGEYAFFMHQSMDGAGGPDLCVVAAAVPESDLNIIGDANVARTMNGQKTVLTYTQSGKMYVAGSGMVELLMVGGGGGGGANHATDGNLGGGGGGGGGVVYKTSFRVKKGIYDVTIGAGGAIGANGGNTTIDGLGVTAYGGGAGGAYNGSASSVVNAQKGASGGGSSASGTAGTAIYGDQDNLGHNGYKGTHQYGPGGGGGAGAAAVANSYGASTPGAGGDGVACAISGVSTYYGGGGAGYRKGRGADATYKAYGGKGGGGYAETSGKLHAGVDGLGGGGGGGTKGGSGIVVISFYENEKICSDDFEITGADVTSRVGGDTVAKFTTDGTTLTVTGYGAVELLVVGGGGGGGGGGENHATDGNLGGAGGGGGGVLHRRVFYVTPGDYPVKIGTGGWRTSGGSSKVFGQTGVFGGVGGHYVDTTGGYAGGNGGSGGGATKGKAAGQPNGASYDNFGNAGATATHDYGPGGGGGARCAAVPSSVGASTPGAGGDGVGIAITGTLEYYGGGGAGYRKGRGASSSYKAYGGKGGGGYADDNGTIHAGVNGTGGGGCGGGVGGKGVVIVRYTRPKKGLILIVR